VRKFATSIEKAKIQSLDVTPLEDYINDQLRRVQIFDIHHESTPTCMIGVLSVLERFEEVHLSTEDVNDLGFAYYEEVLEKHSGLQKGLWLPWDYNTVNTEPRGNICPLVKHTLREFMGEVCIYGEPNCTHCGHPWPMKPRFEIFDISSPFSKSLTNFCLFNLKNFLIQKIVNITNL